jgi:replicative DNA helicase
MSKQQKTVNPFFEKALPQSPEAERGVIGGLLARPDLFDEVAAIVDKEDFHDTIARECFVGMKECVSRGEAINVVTLYIVLSESGSQITSIQLSDLMQNSPPTGTVSLAKKVRELAERRAVMHASICLFESAQNVTTQVKDAANEAARLIDNVLAGRSTTGRQDLRDIVASMVAKAESGEQVRTILTPYEQLNFITGGLHAGEMITLAGRPGTGKTALALNCATSAMFAGNKVGFFSLEMSQESLAERMCAATMTINAQAFRTRRFNPGELDQIREFQKYADRMSAKVFDSPRVDPDMIRAECRKWRRSMGLDLVIIDYLQLVQPLSGKKDSTREREVAEISRSIKQLAIEMDIPVMLLAQLNRSVENREDKTPRLSDLRESGSIEQDSDMVWFLSPWNTASASHPVVDVKLTVAKSRSSSTGGVMLQYVRKNLRFDEVA